jgi:GNAT superfamily N-acetyltransferase
VRGVLAPSTAAVEMPIRAVLRDGSLVWIRPAVPGDHQALTRFFHHLSLAARRLRFFSPAEPSDRLLDTFCTSAHPAQAVTLLALRRIGDLEDPIAVASYFRIDAATAEVAFAVDDHCHGQGVGTVLLDRLAEIAVTQGFTRFDALTLPDNGHARHASGFGLRRAADNRRRGGHGAAVADASARRRRSGGSAFLFNTPGGARRITVIRRALLTFAGDDHMPIQSRTTPCAMPQPSGSSVVA